MSVRATNSLLADIVTVGGIPNSPKMVVLAVNEELKQVTTVWFATTGEGQTATFPAQALDRVEIVASPAKKGSAGRGRGKKAK